MENKYSTKSLVIASYLYTIPEVKFIGTDNQDSKNIRFKFEPRDVAEETVNNFYTGKPMGNIREVFDAYQTLKDLLFEVKNSRR